MINYIYSFFKGENIPSNKELTKTNLIFSPTVKKKETATIIDLLFKGNQRTKKNIEKCNHIKSNKKQIKLFSKALIDLFTQSKFMLKQIDKLNNNIDDKNKFYIQEMINNMLQLNNLFNSIYGGSKK